MIEEVVVQLMRTDVIGNPTLPSICPKNYRRSPLGIQVALNMIVGKGVSKISIKAIVLSPKHHSCS